jgi:hypothetical protein
MFEQMIIVLFLICLIGVATVFYTKYDKIANATCKTIVKDVRRECISFNDHMGKRRFFYTDEFPQILDTMVRGTWCCVYKIKDNSYVITKSINDIGKGGYSLGYRLNDVKLCDATKLAENLVEIGVFKCSEQNIQKLINEYKL